jgi:hypothetical protein
MRSDVNYSHSKNIGEAVGSFCELPIRSYDNFALELDVALDSQSTILRNRAMGCSDIPNTAEILPGEVLCADNIIRRETAAETIGYDAYKEKQPVKKLMVGHNSYDSENSRHNNPHCAVGASKPRQDTPEEMCAYLNGETEAPGFYDKLPQYGGLRHEVVTDGDDKLLRCTDAKGTLLYAFRYIGGFPATYIGGEEVRPLALPQFTVGLNSPSRVVQYFDNGNKLRHAPVEPMEYADEWACTYIPTSHVERITVGGTALFAPEELV